MYALLIRFEKNARSNNLATGYVGFELHEKEQEESMIAETAERGGIFWEQMKGWKGCISTNGKS